MPTLSVEIPKLLRGDLSRVNTAGPGRTGPARTHDAPALRLAGSGPGSGRKRSARPAWGPTKWGSWRPASARGGLADEQGGAALRWDELASAQAGPSQRFGGWGAKPRCVERSATNRITRSPQGWSQTRSDPSRGAAGMRLVAHRATHPDTAGGLLRMMTRTAP